MSRPTVRPFVERALLSARCAASSTPTWRGARGVARSFVPTVCGSWIAFPLAALVIYSELCRSD